MSDDGYIDLPSGTQGFCTVCAYFSVPSVKALATFGIWEDGSITWMDYTSNVTGSDTDNYLCIIDNGTNIRIKNRLGTSVQVRVIYWYK